MAQEENVDHKYPLIKLRAHKILFSLRIIDEYALLVAGKDISD